MHRASQIFVVGLHTLRRNRKVTKQKYSCIGKQIPLQILAKFTLEETILFQWQLQDTEGEAPNKQEAM